MPIVKRSNVPKKPSRGAEPDGGFNAPGRRIDHLIKEHDQLASDAAWEGDEELAKHHTDCANRFRDRLAAGELYDVPW